MSLGTGRWGQAISSCRTKSEITSDGRQQVKVKRINQSMSYERNGLLCPGVCSAMSSCPPRAVHCALVCPCLLWLSDCLAEECLFFNRALQTEGWNDTSGALVMTDEWIIAWQHNMGCSTQMGHTWWNLPQQNTHYSSYTVTEISSHTATHTHL